jgi:cytidylate kinase
MENTTHTIIAISRQMASGGSYIGYLLAKKLDFKYVDREILREAAKNFGTDAGWLEHFDGKSSGIISRILSEFAIGSPEFGCVPNVHPPVYDKDLFFMECRVMNQIMDKYNAVIMGRGGFYALKERPKVFRVYIHAPMEFRVNRLMKVRNINERDAKSILVESDKNRTKFIRDMTGMNWTDSRNYHLCMDSSVIDFNSIVNLIAGFVDKFQA